jgi:hypothetical protein
MIYFYILGRINSDCCCGFNNILIEIFINGIIHNDMLKLMIKKKVFGALCILLLCGCPGGGSSVHGPPQSIKANQPTVLELALSTWGAGCGRITKRYTNVCCHYRLKGEKNFTTVLFKPTHRKGDWQFYECELPPFANVGSEVEYYIDMMFDGVYNKRELETVKIERNIPNKR